MNNDVIDFEDLFEIVLPSGIDSRIESLGAAWDVLYQTNPDNKYVSREYDLWNLWKNKTLNLSFISKSWATGILNELDKWKARYEVAYKSANQKNEAVNPIVWKSEISNALGENNLLRSPIVLVIGTITATIGLAWVINKLSK